jgi:uncharacterized protein DUF1566
MGRGFVLIAALCACGRLGFEQDHVGDANNSDVVDTFVGCHTGFGDKLSGPIGNDQPPFPRMQSFTVVTEGVVRDNNTTLEWQQAVDAMARTWSEAKSYCESLVLDGGCWRMPERIELVSIANYAVNPNSGPAIDRTAFPGTPGTELWSATPLVGSTTQAWFVTYGDGSTGTLAMTTTRPVRCVRSTVEPPAMHYAVGTDVVTDQGTGLAWQRNLDGNSYNFNDAAAMCAGLAIAGGGWRMPSVQEVETIVDTGSTANVSIDTTAFPNTPSGLHWTGTLRSNDAQSGWTIDFGNGVASRPVGSALPVRCVR